MQCGKNPPNRTTRKYIDPKSGVIDITFQLRQEENEKMRFREKSDWSRNRPLRSRGFREGEKPMTQEENGQRPSSFEPSSRILEILCPDDRYILANLEPKILGRRGVRIHTYQNGAEALELADKIRPALCITTWTLEDMDAEMLAGRLKEILGNDFIPLVVAAGKDIKGPLDPRKFAGLLELSFDNREANILLGRMLGIHLRRAERFPLRVKVFSDKHDEYLGTTLDLSTKGMLIGTEKAIDPSTEVEIRFALPGSSRRMSVRARVIRSDTEIINPKVAVAFGFSPLSSIDQKQLENYISSLIAGRTFSWEMDSRAKKPCLRISGRLGNKDDLLELSSEIHEQVDLDLSRLKKIEVSCIEPWKGWLRGLGQIHYPVRVLSVSYSLARQIETDPDLFTGTVIESVSVMHICEECETERNINVSPAREKDDDTGTEAKKKDIENETICPECGGKMIRDEDLPNLNGVPT